MMKLSQRYSILFDVLLLKTSVKAKLLFNKICPEEQDFMPPPPDLEDIIYEEEVGHEVGEGKERDGAGKSEVDEAPDTAQSNQPSNKEETEPITES